MLCSCPLFDPTEFFIQEKGFHSSLLTWATKSPSPGGSFGLGSALHKEKELFSKELSILFDLCKIVQVNLQALNLNLPLQLSHLHILTRHSRETLKGMSGWMGGGREKNQSYQFPLKFKLPLGSRPSISCSLHSITRGTVQQCSPLAHFISFWGLFSLSWGFQSTYAISKPISAVIQQ